MNSQPADRFSSCPARRAFRAGALLAILIPLMVAAVHAQSRIPQTNWTIKYVDSQELTSGYWGPASPATNAIDGNPNTFWITQWNGAQPPLPHEIQVNLGASYSIVGFQHLPIQTSSDGRIAQYEFYVSTDGINWGTAVSTGTLPNTTAQTQILFTPVVGQYVRLRALSSYGAATFATSMAELNVLTGSTPPAGTISSPAANVTITAGGTVSFSGAATGGTAPLTYRWNFGAGSGVPDSAAQNPGTVQFNTPGTFVVTFTTSDSIGLTDANPPTRTITVQPTAGVTQTALTETNWTVAYVDSQELTSGSWGPATPATNAIDGNPNTFWITQWNGAHPPPPHEIQINLGAAYRIDGFNHLPYQGGSDGRIAEFEFYVSSDGVNWGSPVAGGWLANTVSPTQILFAPVVAQYVRLRALVSFGPVNFATSVAELNVLTASGSSQGPSGTITSPAGNVTIVTGGSVNFTGTASDPNNLTPLTYRWNFGTGSGIADSTAQNPGNVTFSTTGTFTVTFTATNSAGVADPAPPTRTITVVAAPTPISQASWSILYVDSQELTSGYWGPATPATNAIDGNPSTFWITQWNKAQPPLPHEIQVNLGASYTIDGFQHLPYQGGTDGRISQYEFYVSTDGVNWGTPVSTGTLPNTLAQTQILFPPVPAHYVRLRALGTYGVATFATSMAELNVLTSSAAPQPPKGTITSPTTNVTITAGATVNFTGSATDPNGAALSYLWNFGAGSGVPDSPAQSPGSVAFNTPGTFVVTFTASDSLGLSDTAPPTVTVTVQPGTGAAPVLIPQSGFSIAYVDSQELTSGYWGPATPATNAIDGNASTFWITQWNGAQPPLPHEIQVNLGATYLVSGFQHLPYQGGANGRIAQFEFYVSTDGVNWGSPVAGGWLPNTLSATSIYFPPVTARYVRLRALASYGPAAFATSLAELNVYSSGTPAQPPKGTITAPAANVTITAGGTVNFTGSATGTNTPLTYDWNFGTGSGIADATVLSPGSVQFNNTGTFTVTFTVKDSLGQTDSAPPTVTVTVQPPATVTPILQTNWVLKYVDSQELTSGSWGPATPGTNAIDGNPNTFWSTQWNAAQPPQPHEIQVDLGATYSISGFTHLPRQDGVINGRIAQYEFYVSADGVNWGTTVASGTLPNTASMTQVLFTPVTARYVRFRSLLSYGPATWNTTLAELGVLTPDQAPKGTITSPAGNVTIPTGGSVNFTATATTSTTNTPLTYDWNFGAGSGLADATVLSPGSVTFNSPGTFTVTFTTKDSLGMADATPPTRVVTVQAPASAYFMSRSGWTVGWVDSQSQPGTVAENGVATNAFDGDPTTQWVTQYIGAQPPPPHDLVINLGAPVTVTGFSYLPRQVGTHGRIGQYQFSLSTDAANWGTPVASGQFSNTANVQQVMFPPQTAQYIWVHAITEVNGEIYTSIAELNLYLAGGTATQVPTVAITAPAANATVAAGGAIDFAATASDPNGRTPLTYRWSVTPGSGVEDQLVQNPSAVHFNVPGTWTVTLTVANSQGAVAQATRTVTVLPANITDARTNWALQFADSQDTAGGHPATNAFDGSTSTFWLTAAGVQPPHEIQIDLGSGHDIGAFQYLPRQDGTTTGGIGLYRFYVSADGVNWGSPVASGTFPNTSTSQQVQFPSALGRYIRLQSTSEVNGGSATAVADLGVLDAQSVVPSVRLVTPKSNYLQTSGTTLSVLADAVLASGQGVRFMLDGGTAGGGAQFDDYTAPYSGSFASLNNSLHTIDVFVIDAGGAIVGGPGTHDQATNVGVGVYYVAMGDSITYGYGDDVPSDNTSNNGRVTGGGFEPVLANLLDTAYPGAPHLIVNQGIPGDRSVDGASQIMRVLQQNPYASYFLVMYGTNDVTTGIATGYGLHPGDAGYAGSYKDYLQRIINDINSAGKTVYLATLPMYRLNTTGNNIVQQYNQVIQELAADPANKIPAVVDLYTYFSNHPEQYYDTLHPNGIGYQSMAQLWSQVLTH